jgi:cellulose biosynthesis protein BcsQ
MKTVAFFNNKGGVGKTSLVYHIAWMCAELGTKVVAIDLDPQSNLSSMFLDDAELEKYWAEDGTRKTIASCIAPILRGLGDIEEPELHRVSNNLHLIVGDLSLSGFEDRLSESWPKCLSGDEAAFRTTTAFYRIMEQASAKVDAELVLIDVGPNLGAINRATLIAADHVVVPLSPSLFSLQGLRNMGPTLTKWRNDWKDRLDRVPATLTELPMPLGEMNPVGYVIMQHVERNSRPTKAFQKWIEQIPGTYQEYVLDNQEQLGIDESHEIGMVKNYQSLMPMAENVHKPIFFLKSADGAIGAHNQAVQKCYIAMKTMAKTILDRVGLGLDRMFE